MVVSGPITESAVDSIAAGVFSKPSPLVVEAYSEPDREPLGFASQVELAAYIKAHVSRPRRLAFVFVVYHVMGGRPVRRMIQLDPEHCLGQKLRYTWDGWGLISVQLYGVEQSRMSRISSNSAARANAWAPTYPEWNSPDVWNWKAVES